MLLGLIALLALCVPAGAEDKAKLDPAKLVGTWNYVSAVKDGKKVPEDNLKKGVVEITKDNITLKSEDGNFVIKYKLDPDTKPCGLKMEITDGPGGVGSKANGIIALDGDDLKICYPPMGGDAPTDFTSKEGSGRHLFVLKRKK
jgi:uncharacterized protein (TIGR03067 family)